MHQRRSVIGGGGGPLGAIGLTRHLASLLHEVDPGDPTAFSADAALLLAVTLAAA